MSNLLTIYIRYVQGVLTIRSHQTQINGWRRLQLHFERLVPNFWELAVIAVVRIS